MDAERIYEGYNAKKMHQHPSKNFGSDWDSELGAALVATTFGASGDDPDVRRKVRKARSTLVLVHH